MVEAGGARWATRGAGRSGRDGQPHALPKVGAWAMGPRETADGGQVAEGLGVQEVRVRDAFARRRAQPYLAARARCLRHLSVAAGTGHEALRGTPAPPFLCHVAAGEVEGGRVCPRLAA